jgi:DNA-binding response OmpR family regulator
MRAEAMAKKILVIEDDYQLLMSLQIRLRASGYQVFTAKGGGAGFAIAQKELPDLVILDILMPEPDGFETLERLKTDEKTKEIPVIMLTALVQQEHIRKASEAGAIDYIVKPFSSETLLEKVKSAIK